MDIILLLEFCLKNTYLSFQDQFYEQVKGVAMGFPVSPIVAILYMQYFEPKALSTAPHLPGFGRGMWMTHLSSRRKSTNRTSYNIINSVDPAIQFTMENNKEDGAIPFLETIVKPEADGNLSITVYRKPTHTDQYFQWDSHHHLSAKFIVIHTLTHRAQIVCSNPEFLHKEIDHLRKTLTQCKYPKWALGKVEKRLNGPSGEVTDGTNSQGTAGTQPTTNEVKTKGHIVIPYTHGLSECIKIYERYGIQTHFKGGNTIKNLLVSSKDKDPMVSRIGAIYWF